MATVYEIVTQRIIESLERGVVPWRQPWTATARPPANLVSKKRYRGINAISTWCACYASPWWVTYRQARELGGHVVKGAHGVPIVFFKVLNRAEDGDGHAVEATSDQATSRQSVALVRYTTVFNVAQTEGLDHRLPNSPELPSATEPLVAQWLRAWPQAPAILHGYRHAAYLPHADRIEMPARTQFENQSAYYATLLHECAHATGHPSRLGRFDLERQLAPFGSEDYSREELVAELATAYLCGDAGLETQIESSAAYLQHWLTTLRSDRSLLVHIAADAQRAADHIRDVDRHAHPVE